jgi:hypothetical protein
MNKYQKIWKTYYGEIPKDEYGRIYEIHHIDGDRHNNHISNLLCVSIKEHYNIHYKQEDWMACHLIADRMKIGLEERLQINKKIGESKVGKRRHDITGENNPMKNPTIAKKVGNKLKGTKRPDFSLYSKNKDNSGNNNGMWGKKHSQKSIQKQREAKLGKYVGENNPAARSVIQLDINNNVIAEYKTIKAAYNLLGINAGQIGQVCRGNGKTAGGYKWKYKLKVI